MLRRLPHAEKAWIENYAMLIRPSPSASVPANEKPKLIGVVGMIRFEEGHGAEVGYGINPEYQGKGYATEALKLFTNLYWTRKSMSMIFVLLSEIAWIWIVVEGC